MGKYTKTEPYKLTAGVKSKFMKSGVEVIQCSRCGREIKVGEKYIRRGKTKRENGWLANRGGVQKKMTLKFYCEECWKKMYIDLPDVDEEEVERGEVLTVPFLILDEVKLKW